MSNKKQVKKQRELSFVYEEAEIIERIDRLREECINIGAIIEKALLDYPLEN